MFDEFDGIGAWFGRWLVEGAGVDVPGVVVLRCIAEQLEFVAAAAGGDGFEVAFLVVEAGDAAGGFVDGDTQQGVFQSEAVGFEVTLERPGRRARRAALRIPLTARGEPG